MSAAAATTDSSTGKDPAQPAGPAPLHPLPLEPTPLAIQPEPKQATLESAQPTGTILLPPPEAQRAIIRDEFVRSNFESRTVSAEGLKFCLVDFKWWTRWCNYVGLPFPTTSFTEDALKNCKAPGVKPVPGEINNSRLLSGPLHLGKDVEENIDFRIVPLSAWEKFQFWYGGGPTIIRESIRLRREGSSSDEFPIEIRPLRLKVFFESDPKNLYTGYVSKALTVGGLIDILCDRFDLQPKNVRLFDMNGPSRRGKRFSSFDRLLEDAGVMQGATLVLDEYSHVQKKWPDTNKSLLVPQNVSQYLGHPTTIDTIAYNPLNIAEAFKQLNAADPAPVPGETIVKLGNTTASRYFDAALVKIRCPAMLKADLAITACISAQAFEIIGQYIYGVRVEIPLNTTVIIEVLFLTQLLQLNELLRVAFQRLVECLEKQPTQGAMDAFIHALRCGKAEIPFVDEYLLHRFAYTYHRATKENRPSVAAMTKTFGQFGEDESNRVLERLLEGSSADDNKYFQPTFEELPTEVTMAATLASLLSTANETGDWELLLEPLAMPALPAGGQPAEEAATVKEAQPLKFKCHGFVLSARWPFFYKLITGGGANEAKRWTLPNAFGNGGITPAALKALLEVVYLNGITESTKAKLTAQDLLSLTASTEFFNLTDEMFAPLLALAESQATDPKNFHSYLQFALDYKMTGMIHQLGGHLSTNFYKFWGEQPFQTKLLAFNSPDLNKVLLDKLAELTKAAAERK